VTCNERIPQQRLGERYVQILAPGLNKLRSKMAEVEGLLAPALLSIGSPSREKVKAAIANGVVRQEEFTGAFEAGMCWSG